MNKKFELGMIVKVDGILGIVVGYNRPRNKAIIEWFNPRVVLPNQLWNDTDGLAIVADPAKKYRAVAAYSPLYKITYPDGRVEYCPQSLSRLLNCIENWTISRGLACGNIPRFYDDDEFIDNLEADGHAIIEIRTALRGDYSISVCCVDG